MGEILNRPNNKRLNVLHSAQMRKPEVGVVRQMEYEQQAADDIGLTWHSRMFTTGFEKSPIVVVSENDGWWGFKSGYYKWLKAQCENYDIVIIRYAKYDPFQYFFIRSCNIPVISMHHTLEVFELIGNGNWRSRVLAEIERFVGRRSLALVDAVAAVTNQIGEYQKSRSGDKSKTVLLYSNGAVYDGRDVLPSNCCANGYHEFIFLSSRFPPWLGLDILFEGARKSREHFKVHVVGKLTNAQLEMLKNDGRFVCHGYLSHEELDELMVRCTLGLSTFGIHRKKFTEGNTLKAREYLRAGLPVYAGHLDIFDETFRFHQSGPADFDRILEYAEEMKGVDRKVVSTVAKPLIEKKQILRRFYREISNLRFIINAS